MRYIDADKIIYTWLTDANGKEHDGVTLQSVINAQPTADVRENVRGKWIHDEITRNENTIYIPNAKCSICDCYVFQESNFCPNCGADMRGKL